MKAYETKKKLALSLAVAMVASSAPVLAFADTAIVAQAEAKMTVEEIIASVSAAINDPFLAAGLARIEAGKAAVATLPDGATKTALTETLQTARHMYDGLEQINQIWVALGAAGWQTNYKTEVAELQAIIAQLDAAFPGGSAFLNNFKTAVTETGLAYNAFEAIDVADVNPTAANIAAAKEAVSKIMNPVVKANAQLRIQTEIENQGLAVVSVSAINKTTVELTLSSAIDSAKAENFAIEGAKVNSATLSEDGKKVTLSVSGLGYDKSYTVTFADIKVNNEVVELTAAEFKTPAVTALWKLEVSPKENQVVADGADNTVIEFKLLGEDDQVDVNADNVVLEIGTTFGNLANTRVTIQDGVGQVVLSSEYSTSAVTAQISAKIIEASEDYKELIGEVVGQGAVNFVPSGTTLDPNAVTFLDAESNQADRVVLYFDKAIDVATFVKVDETTGDFETITRADGIKKQDTKDNVNITVEQDGDTKEILGFKAVEGNAKAVEVILAKTKAADPALSNTLTDNQTVKITAIIGNTNNNKTFTLTDARQPEVTSVTPEGLRVLNLKFSESVVGSNIIIDGQLVESDDFTVTYGEFNAAKGIDYRDTAKIELKPYAVGRPGAVGTPGGTELGNNIGKQRYFEAGSHSVTVHQLKDFAGLTDNANVSSSQLLTFNIVADSTAPTAKVTVESPEQFRITFDKEIEETAANIQTVLNGTSGFQIYDTTNAKYVDITAGGADDVFKVKPQFVVTQPDPEKAEFVVELTTDWTKLLTGTKDTYANYKFQFAFENKFFTNGTNGVKSGKVELNLNSAGSALNTVDNASPVIDDIVATKNANVYTVQMNEPVKLPGNENAGVTDTLSTAQGLSLPAVQVEFQGKDKDGKIVVVPGTVGNEDGTKFYSNKNGDDKAFYVTTNYADPVTALPKNLEDLVKEGYSADWKVVVKSISDDVGNTAATVTRDFKVAVKETSSLFYILTNENTIGGSQVANEVFAYDNATSKDIIEVTFSKAIVHTGGTNDLTNPANWTLNGKALENVESITVADGNGDPKDGNETVIITFKDANALKSNSNVITVNRNIVSKDGTKLTGEFEVVAETITEAAADQLAADAVDVLIAGLPAAGAVTAADEADILAARAAFDALTPAQQAKVKNLAVLEAAEKKIAELENPTTSPEAAAASKKISDLPALAELKLTDKAAVEAARADYDKLTAAQKAEVKNLAVLEAAEKKIADLEAQQGEAAQGTVNVATVGDTKISRITIATADLGTQFRRQGDTNVKQYGETLQFVSTGKTKETTIELLDANGDVVGTIVVDLVKGTFNTAIQK